MGHRQASNDVDSLNRILAELEKLPPEETRLVREHLEGARFYLTGAMPEELAVNLDLAEQSLDSLPDADLQARIRKFIDTHR